MIRARRRRRLFPEVEGIDEKNHMEEGGRRQGRRSVYRRDKKEREECREREQFSIISNLLHLLYFSHLATL